MRGIIVLAVSLAALLASAVTASAHGWPTNLPSRQALCANQVVANCGNITWEPQSVEGPDGFPAAGPADGAICAGGHLEFAVLNFPWTPSHGQWPAVWTQPGDTHRFAWRFTVLHKTKSFRYFMTRDDWDPTKPLTRAGLDPTPIAEFPYGGQPPHPNAQHDVTLPTAKTDGHHIILAVWDLADRPAAVYACSDVVVAGI